MSDFYLLAAERACSIDTMMRDIYRHPDPAVAQRLLEYNGFTSPGARLMPGELMIVPSLTAGPAIEPARVGRSVRKANYFMRNSKAEPAPEQFNENFGWIRELIDSKAAGVAKNFGETTATVYRDKTKAIHHRLIDFRRSYEVALATPGQSFLKQTAANSARHFIESDIKEELVGIPRKTFLANPHRNGLKDQLGISSKALKHQFKTGRSLKELDNISLVANKAQQISTRLKKGLFVVKVVDLGSTTIDISTTYMNEGMRAGNMKVGREASKTMGSAVGARIGAAVATGAVALFGIGTGGLGPAAIALGAFIVGSVAGGTAGERLGEGAWEAWGDDIYTIGEDALDFFATSGLQ